MEKFEMTDDLMAEITRIDEHILDTQAALDHFAQVLRVQQETQWDIIRGAFPETKGWVLRFDRAERTIVKLYPEKLQPSPPAKPAGE